MRRVSAWGETTLDLNATKTGWFSKNANMQRPSIWIIYICRVYLSEMSRVDPNMNMDWVANNVESSVLRGWIHRQWTCVYKREWGIYVQVCRRPPWVVIFSCSLPSALFCAGILVVGQVTVHLTSTPRLLQRRIPHPKIPYLLSEHCYSYLPTSQMPPTPWNRHGLERSYKSPVVHWENT